MTTIADVRAKFPEYSDMSDSALADAMHKKFYADMPREEFNAKIGFKPVASEIPGARKQRGIREAIGEELSNFSPTQLGRDIAGGAIRGAGSIGATLLRPFESADENADRRSKMDAALQQLIGADPEAFAYSVGKFGAEVAGTAGVGGALAKGAALIPGLAKLAPALASGGFQTGMTGIPNVAAKVAGGAVTGAAGAAAVNSDEMAAGAAIGAAVPVVVPPIARGVGKVAGKAIDFATGRAPTIAAAKIARDAAGQNLPAVKAALSVAPANTTAGQAAYGVDADMFQALAAYAEKKDPTSYYRALRDLQGADQVNELARIAGGATATEARAAQEASKNALGKITTPMRETELLAAGEAGRVAPVLAEKAARFGEAAAAKVEDVRRFSGAIQRADDWAKTWAPSAMGGDVRALGIPRYPQAGTFPGQLAGKAENVAAQSAESSLLFGEVARDAEKALASLEANGLRPLKSDGLVAAIGQKLANPEVALNPATAPALKRVSQMMQDWTNKFGVITPEALYAIRKNGVTGVIQDLYPAATEKQKAKFAQSIMSEVRPLIDDAIESAGGTGWRSYLKTFESGMHGIEQSKLGAKALEMYRQSPDAFLKLVRGNDPKAVEKVFGPGSYDIVKEMGAKMAPLEKVAGELERDIAIGKQATAGTQALGDLLNKDTLRIRFPNLLNRTASIANKTLDVLEGKINEKTMAALSEGMKSGKSAYELLNTLPTSERSKILQILINDKGWAKEATAPMTAFVANALSPRMENRNALAGR